LGFENTKAWIRSLSPISGNRNLLRISNPVGINLSAAQNIKILNERILLFFLKQRSENQLFRMTLPSIKKNTFQI
jgi:hypothetical protein